MNGLTEVLAAHRIEGGKGFAQSFWGCSGGGCTWLNDSNETHAEHVAVHVAVWLASELAKSGMRDAVWDGIFWATWRQRQGDYADEILENHRRKGLDPRHCNDGMCLTAQAVAESLSSAALAAVAERLTSGVA